MSFLLFSTDMFHAKFNSLAKLQNFVKEASASLPADELTFNLPQVRKCAIQVANNVAND